MAGPWEAFKHADPFESALSAEGVSGRLADVARSIYQQESGGGRNTRTSNAGAVGGMQIIPATFQRVADKGWRIDNPEHNLRAGIRYLKQLETAAGGDPKLIAAGYYGGEGAIPLAQRGQALRDPRNPNAPDTLQYGSQVANRLPPGRPWEAFAQEEITPDFSDAKAGTAQAPLSRTARVLRGIKDPLDAAAQIAYNAVPAPVRNVGDRLNNYLSEKTGMVSKVPEGGLNALIADDERKYQQGRESAGSSGFDAYRTAGNVAATLPLVSALPATAPTLGGRVGLGALAGGAAGALQPVTEGEFLPEKAKQLAIGSTIGGLIPVAGSAFSRVISPNASANPQLQALKDAGVRPTIGQALGGAANRAEEKLQSLPIMGDAITAARRRGVEDFNKATINKALEPIGERATQAGTEGISAGSKAISTAYETALNKLGGVKFDGQFSQEIQSLSTLAKNLTPDMARKFQNELRNRVIGRMSPSGGMDAKTFKNVDSELGTLARDYGKSVMGSEKEFANAIRELQASIRRQAERVSTEYAAGVRPADAAFARMVRVESAGKKAALQDGVFTPGQLMQAVREADQSVRKSATARGDALMQDFASAGQNVLGNKYPDSGTAGRMLLGIGGLASGAVSPAIPLSLGAGALAYMTPAQRLAVALASARPKGAKAIADAVRRTSPRLGAPGGVLGSQLVEQ